MIASNVQVSRYSSSPGKFLIPFRTFGAGAAAAAAAAPPPAAAAPEAELEPELLLNAEPLLLDAELDEEPELLLEPELAELELLLEEELAAAAAAGTNARALEDITNLDRWRTIPEEVLAIADDGRAVHGMFLLSR